MINNDKFKTRLLKKKEDSFPFSIICLPHLYFHQTTSDSNTLLGPSNQILKIMQKQGSKERCLVFGLNKIFDKIFQHFGEFWGTQQITSSNFSYCIDLELSIQITVCFMISFLLVRLFVFCFVCMINMKLPLLLCFASVCCFYVFLFFSLSVHIFYFNCFLIRDTFLFLIF